MSKVEALVAELRAEAEEVDRGEFSLDGNAARKRFERFVYHDRQQFLQPIVEGLAILGAKQVEVGHSGGDVTADARGLVANDPSARLRELHAATFSERGDASTFGFARLAVGVDMALGHEGIKRVVVEFSGETGTWAGVYARGVDAKVAELERRPPGIRILFDRGFLDEMKAYWGSTTDRELETVREAVRYADYDVWVAGVVYSRQRLELEFEEVFEGDRFRIRAGSTGGREPARIIWLSGGVIVEATPPEWSKDARGVAAIVELDRPARDASQMKVLEDARFNAACKDVRTAFKRITARRGRSGR